MIYIRIELWPLGNKAASKCLHEAIIHNTGGSVSSGQYRFLLSRAGGFRASDEELSTARVKNPLRSGEIHNFPRLRLSALDLLFRALRAGLGDRSP